MAMIQFKTILVPVDFSDASEIQLNGEASVKTNVFVALLFALTLTAGTAAAQPAPFN